MVPVPFRLPALGYGLGLVGGYLFRSNAEADTSHIGLIGFKTENDSRGAGAGFSYSAPDNAWKFDLAAGKIDLFYDLAVRDRTVSIRQEMPILRFELAVQSTPGTFLGTRITYQDTQISPKDGPDLPAVISDDRSLSVLQSELTFLQTRLDDADYPTQGTEIEIAGGPGWILKGPDRDFSKGYAQLRGFTPALGGVLAGEFTICGASDQTPYYLLCSLGGTDSLRGFSATEYYGRSLISVQGEYRGRFSERFGYALFAGAGNVGESLGGGLPDISYSGGIGARLRVSKEFKLDMSVDYAVNNFNEDQVHIYVGQRF